MRLQTIIALGIIATFSLCAIYVYAADQLRLIDSAEVPPHALQVARLIAAQEMVKQHAVATETDPNVRPLLVAMCDQLSRSADIGVTWTGRQFGVDAKNADQGLTEFERSAVERLLEKREGPREVWNGDHNRYVRAVTADGNNCIRCHETRGKDQLIGFVSLKFEKPLWK